MAQSYPTSYIDFINRAQGYAQQRAATTVSRPPVQEKHPRYSTLKPTTSPVSPTIVKKSDGQNFWDPVGSAVGDFLNKLGAGRSGVQNAIDKGSDYSTNKALTNKPQVPTAKPTNRGGQAMAQEIGAQNAATLKGFGEGFTASWNSDYENPNYMTGEKLIANERVRQNQLKNADLFKGNVSVQPEENLVAPLFFLPDFKINYTSDFWPGLVLDVAMDPLTWISEGTAGVGMAAARGATSGARAAATAAREAGSKGLGVGARAIGGAAKGVAVGAGKQAAADAYKVGRFSKTIKPVGVQQWYEVKKFNTFDKIARRAGLTTGDLIAAASGKVTAKELADSFAQKAEEIVASGGKPASKQVTEKSIQDAIGFAQPYLGTAAKFYEGALASASGGRLAGGSVSKSLIPIGGMGEIRFGARNSETTAGTQLAQRTEQAEVILEQAKTTGDVAIADRAQVELDSLGLTDAGTSRPPAVQDTSPMTPHARLNIHPRWGAKEQYGVAVETIQKAISELGVDSPVVQEMKTAFNDIFDVQPITQVEDNLVSEATSVNPTAYPDNNLADEVFGVDSPEETIASIDNLLELNKTADVDGPADQAERFDLLLDRLPFSDNIVARLKWALAAGDEDTVAEAIFGTQRGLYLYTQESAEAWWDAITAIADFPYEIPGYTSAARDLVKQYEDLLNELELKPGSTRRGPQRLVDENGEEVKAIDWNAMAQMTDMDFGSPEAMIDRLYAEYRAGVQAIGAGGEDVLASRAGRDVELNYADIKPEYNAGEEITSLKPSTTIPEKETFNNGSQGMTELSDADMAVAQGEFAGQYVDIFGRIVRNPEPDINAALESLASQAKLGLKTGKVSRETAKFISRERTRFSSNTMGYQPGSSLAHRVENKRGTEGKKSAEWLMKPDIPESLADIYDHVAGFARVPLGFAEWKNALTRISESKMQMSRRAANLLNTKSRQPVDRELLASYNKYVEAFNQIDPTEVKGARKSELAKDLSAGVNVFGDIYKDKDSFAGRFSEGAVGSAKTAVSRTEKEAKALEAQKTRSLKGFTARVKERRAKAKLADMELEDIAVSNRVKVGEQGSLADPNNPNNDPIRLRTTTGSWASPDALLKYYLNATDASNAASYIENAKMFRDGLRNGLRGLWPMLEWRTKNYRVFETIPLASGPESVIALTNAVKTHAGEIREALNLVRNRKEVIAPQTPILGGEIGVFALPEGKFIKKSRIGTGSLLTREGRATIGDLISKIIADSGIDFGANVAKAEDSIAEIIDEAARSETLWTPSQWASKIAAKRFETGASRPALQAEVKEGILEHHLRDVGAKLQRFNEEGSPGFYDEEMRALVKSEEGVRALIGRHGAMRSYVERGIKEPPSIQGLIKELQSISISGSKKEYDINSLVRLAQVIADATNEQAVVGKFLKSVDGVTTIRSLSQGNMVADYIRSKAPQLEQLLTNDNIRRAIEVEAVNSFMLWDGDAIQKLARSTNFGRVIGKGRERIDGELSRIRTKDFVGRISLTATNAFARSIKAVTRKGDRIFAQDSSRGIFNLISSEIDASPLFKTGSIESWNAKLLALRLTRQIQHESGIFDGTRLTRYGGRIRPEGGQDHDFAYISFLDVIDSMTSAVRSKNLSQDLHLALSDDAPRVLFDLLKIDGKTFPIDVLQETAVLAMKMMSSSTMKEAERAVWLNDSMIVALRNKPGYEGWANAIDANVRSEASRAIAMIAGSLANPKVTENLFKRHRARAALAVASATEKSARITQPIMSKLSEVADNIFANSGERTAALEGSIDALRAALATAGFSKGSLEAVISMKTLEKHQLKSFTPMEFNTARHTIRLKAAYNEATPQARAAAIAEENASLARSTKKIADEAQVLHTATRLQEAIDTGNPEAVQEVVEQSTNLAGDASETANLIADHIKNGNSPLSKRTPEEAEAGKAHDYATADLEALKEEFMFLTQWNDPALAPPGRIDELTSLIAAQKAKVDELGKIYYGIKEGRLAALAAEQNAPAPVPGQDKAAQMIAEGAGEVPGDLAMPLSEYATRSKFGLLHQSISAQAGKAELVSDFGAIRSTLDSMATITQSGMDKMFKKYRVKNKELNRWDMPLIYNKIAVGLIDAPNASVRRSRVEALKGTEREFAEEFIKVMGHFFDDAYIARMGLLSGHMQDFFDISSLRGHRFMNFGQKTELYGYSVADYLKRAMAATLSAPVDKGGMDWYRLFRNFNYVTQKAMQAPELMANFSARFGHLADNYASVEDAIADGYVRVAGAGGRSAKGFTKFLDPKQVYPREIIEQLANIEAMYEKMIPKMPTTPVGEAWSKAIKIFDTTTTILKKSLTTWSPANHLLNAQGELMVNFMAGVYNPSVYGKSLRILDAGGEIKKTGQVNTTRGVGEIEEKVPRSLEDLADASGGVKIRIGGKTKTMSWEGVYLYLQKSGILMTNNSMEDFIIATSEELVKDSVNQGVKIANPVSRALHNIFGRTDIALANFASIRDNVFRIAHAVDVMEKGNFRSMEEMASHIQYVIGKYHPTLYGLSNFESKVMRRLAFFYSWKRGALRAVMETIMDYPTGIMLPAYATYAISGAMGGNPAGIGHPAPADPDLPEWARMNNTGPTWYDEDGEAHTFSLNTPSSDIMSTFFGGLRADERLSPTQNAMDSAMRLIRDNSITQTNPFISLATSALTGVTVSESASYEVSDWGQYIQDQMGLGKISRATGIALINDNGILQQRTGGGNDNPDRAATNQMKGWMSLLTPMRYNKPSDYSATAKRENTEAKNIKRRREEKDPTLAWWEK